jgi:hypothetical protein
MNRIFTLAPMAAIRLAAEFCRAEKDGGIDSLSARGGGSARSCDNEQRLHPL